MERFYFIFFFLFIMSCNNPDGKHNDENRSIYSDTILLANNDLLFSCCEVRLRYIVLSFTNKPNTIYSNSSNQGELTSRKYKIGGSVFFDFLYSPSTRYDTIGLISSLYCNSPKDDCIPSPIIEDVTGKTSRIHCIDSNLVCNGFGKFDGKGYLYLKVEDYSPTPIPKKEAFAAELLSSYMIRDTIFYFSSTINGVLDSNRFALCMGKTLGRLKTGQGTNANELYVVLNKEWDDGCLGLYSLANCIIEKFFQDKKFKMITLVAQQPEENNFKRLATFIIHENTDAIQPGEVNIEFLSNFVDCIWIDESFSNKLYSEEDCYRWQMGR